jgi:glycosyltransferase involved in cell wall biosynthesis
MRFESTPDGHLWTQATSAYDFWCRYLEVFDEVNVIARVNPVDRKNEAAKRVDGPGVRFTPMPHYIGPGPFITKFPEICTILRHLSKTSAATIYRIPSILSEVSAQNRNGERPPFGVEVVGDPHDVFGPDVVRHPMRPFFRWFFARHVRNLCRQATAVSYVNESILKKRYPPHRKAYVSSYSSVELPDEAFRAPQRGIESGGRIGIVFIGSLEQIYKGADLLIHAVGCCRKSGFNVEAVIVGEGRHKEQLVQQAHQAGLQSYVRFLGQLPAGEDVRRVLDDGDLFVLPARTEGLPRVIIEAMARAKPCISTTVGGIPELLPSEDLVPPNDGSSLAKKIMEVLSDPERMVVMGRRNYQNAGKYHKRVLDQRRREFYGSLRYRTERWLKEKKTH